MGSSVEGVNKFQSAERASPEDSRFGQIIGNSPALEFVLAEVERVATTDSTVLVLGETGTGKELIARAIHNLSTRCGRPFIKLNCAAIPFDLLESGRLYWSHRPENWALRDGSYRNAFPR